ncbi:MAG: hypothetical protein K0Q72_3064, partial [Armatimonadetes bacterium]|nr:hypothetical protein [Armatimonadota bacterium]
MSDHDCDACTPHVVKHTTRRDMLRYCSGGFGMMAFSALAAASTEAAEAVAAPKAKGPLASRAPHFAPRAKRVIFLFMHGGPSAIDTFDPKPRLDKENGG